MNELIHNFMNQIDDVNKITEMSLEEFIKIVKSNKLISEDDGNKLIESFKKISSKKSEEDGSSDSDQRKKKYREQHKNIDSKIIVDKNEKAVEEREDNDNSIER